MNALRQGVLALALLAACHAVDAFGPKTHLWIADQILADLRNGCNVRLASGAYRVAADLCAAITSNPESFYAGALGPDLYPDIVSGQNTTHSGVKDGWTAADFLEHVTASADTPSSRAFAAGYLTHAAGDIFGHSYVNAYAGDDWNLGDERVVELRHSVIEKYIDAHLPPLSSGAAGFHAPPDFVRDALIHNGKTLEQYRHVSFARHLASMMRVKAAVDDLAARSDALSSVVPDVLAHAAEFTLTLGGQLVDGEAALALASAALDAPKARAAAQRVVVDDESKAVAEAGAAVARHDDRLTELAGEAEGQQLAAAAACAAARQALSAANDTRARLSALQKQILSVPQKIVVTACQSVTEPLCEAMCREGSRNPLCALCDVPREVCTSVERANDEYQRLNEQVIDAERHLGDLEATAGEETAKADAATASANALLEQRATEAAAGAGIVAARNAAEVASRAADEQYRSTMGTVASMQRRIDELRSNLEEKRKGLVDAKAVADQLRGVATQLNLLSHVLHNWQRGIDQAGGALAIASDRVGHAMLGERIHLFSEYRRWLACEGAVYMAAPYQVAGVACSVETGAQRLKDLLGDIAGVVLPGPLKDLHAQLDVLKVKLDTELRAAITGATTDLVRFVSNQATADFVDLLVNPGHATRAKLDEVLALSGEAGEKDILVFENGADLIDRDIGLANGTLDPNAFAALSSSVTLAKLSLLDQAEVRRLVLELGGPEAEAAYDGGKYDVGRSILLSATRSLDGNEQWQPFGLPYPRAVGASAPSNAPDRHYGFGPRDAERHGFPLFIDPVLRKRVFLRLFPSQIHGEIAKRPEMSPGRYPFPICERNPFPVTFLPSGDPAPVDNGCVAQGAADQVETRAVARTGEIWEYGAISVP